MKEGGRFLLYDVETSPLISYNWGIYEQNAIEVIQDFQILCFAYKWLDEKKTYVVAQDDFKGYKAGVLDDRNVVIELHKLFEEADVIIAHNGNQFDQKKVQARMQQNRLKPPSPYKQIDTKLIAKRYAAFTSNKLDDLGTYLKLGNKKNVGGFTTWKGCMAGDKKAWNKMKKYNIQDVVLLEKVYLQLRPWIKNHPSYSSKVDACPKCGVSGRMHNRGFTHTTVNKYKRFQCQACGGWSQSRTAEKNRNKVLYTN